MTRKSIIFDLDGTLIDSMPVTVSAFDAAKSFLGLTGGASALDFLARAGIPLTNVCEILGLPPHFAARYRIESLERRHEIKLYPGIESLLVDLSAKNCALSIVTGKDRVSTLSILDTLGILKQFDVIVTPDDPVSPKPSPDAVFYVVATLGLDLANCIFVGDSTLDMECGSSAAIPTVGCTWGVATDSELRGAGATSTVDSVARLSEVLLGMPKE